MFKRRSLPKFVIIAGLLVFVAGLFNSSECRGQQAPTGVSAPLFQLTSLEGETVALADLRGKFVVIHFAASW